jgi:alkaline phosphatase
MSNQQEDKMVRRLGRRAFLKSGTLFLAGSALLPGRLLASADDKSKLRLGLVTDLHYADKLPSGSRHFRESITKVAEAAKRFDQEKPDLAICLGDLIDSAASLDAEKSCLKRIVKEFSGIPGKHHYVLGNHCVENLTKPEFLGIVGQEKSYYSFDANGCHFAVLDACFNSDGAPYGRKNFRWADAKLPPAELEWLQGDLRQSPHKSIVFVHQCLDVVPPFGVQNGSEVRKILEASGKVLAVFQGHYHWGNYQEVGGLHYCTMSAIIEGSGPENNAYAVMDILPGDIIRITGFRKQKSHQWS